MSSIISETGQSAFRIDTASLGSAAFPERPLSASAAELAAPPGASAAESRDYALREPANPSRVEVNWTATSPGSAGPIFGKSADSRLGLDSQRQAINFIYSNPDLGSASTFAGAAFEFLNLSYSGELEPVAPEVLVTRAGEAAPERTLPWMFVRKELHDLANPLQAAMSWGALLGQVLPYESPARPTLEAIEAHLNAVADVVASARNGVGRSALQVGQGQVFEMIARGRSEAVRALELFESLSSRGELAAAGGETAEFLAKAIEASRAMADRIEDMDRSARLNGEIRLRIVRAEAWDIIDRALRALGPLAALKNVILGLEVPEMLPEIHCDPGNAARILENLLTNAIKFTAFRHGASTSPGTSGRVSIRARVGEGKFRGMVSISVEDNGPGIDPADHRRIFEEGGQSGPREHREAGSGLGLSIALRHAKAQGGGLLVDSAPGRGSTFTLLLPAARP